MNQTQHERIAVIGATVALAGSAGMTIDMVRDMAPEPTTSEVHTQTYENGRLVESSTDTQHTTETSYRVVGAQLVKTAETTLDGNPPIVTEQKLHAVNAAVPALLGASGVGLALLARPKKRTP